MSFDDWVKEAKNKYVYVGFKSTAISPDSKKVKLIKYEQEHYIVRPEHICYKKHFIVQKINKQTSCCTNNDNLDNNDRISCSYFLNSLQENTEENIQKQTIDNSIDSEKSYIDMLEENIKKKQLETTLKIIKQRYHKNKLADKNLDNRIKKNRGRPKKVTI